MPEPVTETMKIGIFAKTFSGTTPQQVFSAARAAGFAAVQYNMACSGLSSLPAAISATAVNAITGAAKATNIQIAAVSATYNMTDPSPERRQAGREGFAAIAASAKAMGTNLVTVCSGSLDPENQWRWHRDNATSQAWSEMCREFEILCAMAAQHEIVIGVEPEHANIVSTAVKARQLLDSFKGGPIRIVVDPANLLEDCPIQERHALLSEAFDLLAPDIALAHVKDRDETGNVVAAGCGVVDWNHYLRGLEQAGYAGALIAHGIAAEEAAQVSAFLRTTLARL
jgi:sugar phosphate isomerase/epimerase